MTFCTAFARGQRFERSRIPCKRPLSSSRVQGGFAAGPVSVRREADAQADCAREKGLQMHAFAKRLKGFEPSTFCMASSTCASRLAPNNAANKPFCAPARARRNNRDSPGNHGGYRTQTGPRLGRP
jgi:hypothetical protein